ncbi:hypothetical protein DBR32_06215 [Taibaiella sp. KBW10]|uniref:Ig-like domain-containing protein n=1 Tax=Taibaiella sp. KBW10 TaxID=2153357 RepID=UPI000F5A7FFB|nr:T9SS type A sorting domain-containing protein [Taibaiella sp. KBW10]RQO31549.1 hypothetical protein DBR32_06215 [Taibaiella sp. KBW10]
MAKDLFRLRRHFCILLLLLSVSFQVKVSAQTPMYFKGTGTGSNTIPMNNTGSHCQQIYEPSDFSALPISGLITKIYLRNAAAGGTGTYTNFSVSFLQNTLTTFPNTNFLTGFTPALLVPSFTVNGNATAGGWYEVPLTIPFLYDNTKTLIVEIKYTAKTGGMSGPTSTATGNKRLSIIAAPGPLVGNLATIWGDFGMDVIPSVPCTNPPVAGTTISNAPGVNCIGSTVNLGLTGHVTGSGQTYEWESSANNITYTSLGAPQLTTPLTINISATRWYRCKVVCSGGTPAYSTPLQISVAAGLAGTYTINSAAATAGTNFNNFTDAATALNCGITAPVVINVVAGSGPYNETVSIGNISGASAVNTVRINGNGATLQFNPTVAADANIFTLNGTQYFTLNNLKIKTNSNTFGWGVLVTGAAARDSIINCDIDLSAITGTSSTAANGIVVSGSATSPTTGSTVSHLYIGNNTVTAGSNAAGGAYYGIAVSGQSTTVQNDSIYVVGNTVTNFYYYGIRYAQVNGGALSNNNIHRSAKTAIGGTAYGIYAYYCKGIETIGNRIHDMAAPGVNSTSTFYAMYNYHYNNTAATPILIANNVIYNMGNYSGTQYLLQATGPSLKVYHNTVDASEIQGTSNSAMYGLYMTTNTGSEAKNNIINITGGNTGIKYGIYVSSVSTPADLQKNNVYVNSTQTGAQTPYYYGAAYASLAAFQTAQPTQEIGSPNIDPQFQSPATGDFSPAASGVINSGVNVLSSVPTDISGVARTITPTIGAFEYVPSGNNDAKTVGILNPSGNFCANTTAPVKVIIGNGGANNLNTVQINWTVNGVAQTPFAYTGTLVPPTAPGQSLDTVTLGTITFATGINNLVIWTSLPNGLSDPNHANDTATFSGQSSLPGNTYTINNAAPTAGTNFNSFNDFADALSYGICGPVIANVVAGSGPYNETVSIGNIGGVSAVNTIRINGNGATLQFNPTGTSDANIFTLNGTQYFTLNNLKIKTNSNTYGWGILVTGAAARDSIINCDIDLSAITGTSSANANGIVVSGSTTAPTTGSNVSHLYIGNNTVTAGSNAAGGGYYGIAVSGLGTSTQNDSIYVVGNTVTNFYYYGIRYAQVNGGKLSNNNIHRSAKTAIGGTAYGIYAYYCKGIEAVGNRIHDMAAPGVSSTSSFYAMYNYHFNNTAATPILIANNIIYNMGNYSGIQYLLQATGPSLKVYHNTVDASALQGTSTSAMYGLYMTTNTGSEAKNNIINITGGNKGIKYGIYVSSATTPADLQKNNVYVNSTQTGTQTPYYYGAAYASLAAFQAAQPTQEIGSPNVNPQLLSSTTGDLLPLNPVLMTAGNNLTATVPTDIIGTARSATPTIGAFEFAQQGINNARAFSFLSPMGNFCAGTIPVEVMFGNVGTNNISSLQINWRVNGVLQTPYTYNSTLVPLNSPTGQSLDTIVLGNATLNPGANNIIVWTSLPNGVADAQPANDTISKIATTANFLVSKTKDSICANEFSILSLSPGTGYSDGALAWEYSTDGTTWITIPNTDTVNYAVTNLGVATQYRVKILTGGANCISNTATVFVKYVSPPAVTAAESCSPAALTLQAVPSTGNTLKWYDNLTTTTVLATSSSITTPILYATKTYYVVSVSSGGCESVRTPVKATIHILPPVNLGNDLDTCIAVAGSFNLNPGTQHPGATYLWDDNTTGAARTVTQSGMYYVTVTDTNTCSSADSIIVNVSLRPIVDLEANGTNFCIGGSKVLDAGPGGENGGDYYWTTGATTRTITVVDPGTYIVYVTTNQGCLTVDTVEIVETGYSPTTNGILALATGPMGFNFNAVNAQNVVNYEWDFGDNTPVSNAVSPNHTYAAGGVYSIKLRTFSVCDDKLDSSTVYIVGTGLKELTKNEKLLHIYPNPNNGKVLFIEALAGVKTGEIVLYNTLGQTVYKTSATLSGTTYKLELPDHLASGMYNLYIQTNKGPVSRKLEIIK